MRERARVFFAPFSASGPHDSLAGKLPALLEATGFLSHAPAGSRVAVKIHPGEKGNLTYLRPGLIRATVDELKSRGFKPFATETTTLYCRERFSPEELYLTASGNGFTRQTLGCPFVVADEKPGAKVKTDDEEFPEVVVAREIADSDALIVVSHVTAHIWTAGLAGAIKQLGMGCVEKSTKASVHRATTIMTDDESCDGCGECSAVCKHDAVSIENGIAVRSEKCARCGVCMGACPNGALSATHDYDHFARGLAASAAAVRSLFGEKACFLNFLIDITWHCDCEDFSDVPVFPDAGVLASSDPVAVDSASADMINASYPLKGSKADTPKVVEAVDRIKALTGIDWRTQLRYAKKARAGTFDYDLIPL